MFSNESIYNEIDSYSNHSNNITSSNVSGNRLFNLNDSQNIWSSDKMCPIDNNFFLKNRSVLNANTSNSGTNGMPMTDRFTRGNRKPPGNRSETNLIVNYLPDGFYEKDLFELFSKAGSIIHYHVVRNKDNRSECYGFVDYEKACDAEKAIDMFHQFQIQNKKLKVQNAAEGLLIKEEDKYRAMKGLHNIGYNVEIRNAPSRWTVNDVKNIFGKYGDILRVTEQLIDDISNVENAGEIKTKTFNVIFRYETIAQKVIKKKHNQIAEPMWPLELELTFRGQEVIDIPTETTRSSRPGRSNKPRFDQMSDCSWETKLDSSKFDSTYYQKSYDNSIYTWGENEIQSRSGLPLTSNGRPILKHKDNLMHLNGGNALCDSVEKWSNSCPSNTTGENNTFFDNKLRGSCNDIKAIWEPKEFVLTEALLPNEIFVRTPLLPSRFRNEDKKHRANIWFKMENMQPTGSFKLRGMAYWCYKAKLDGVQLVVSSSGGNAGLAAAYACRMLKLKCTVVVSHNTPVGIIGELIKENADVIQEGSCWKEAHMKAESIVASYPRISRLVHPFDNALLWGGYESIVDEIVTDMKGARLDMIVLSVGGGGLLNGIAQGISKHKLNKITAILAMETEGTACFNQSMSVNQIVSIIPDSVATSLGANSVSQRTWEIFSNKEFHLFSKVCSDSEAIEACCQFLNEQNCLVEPACGAALSALYNGTIDQMAECRNCDLNVAVIVCGGRCIDIQSLLEMRHVYSALLPNPTPYEPAFDNLSNYDVNDRFLSLNLNNPSKDSLYNNHPSLESDLFYGTSSRCFDSNVSNYNMFPSITKNTIESNNINKSHILTENKFGYQRNVNENNSSSILHSSNYNFQSLINHSEQNNSFHHSSSHHLSNDLLMSSPVGSQHSDKENRLLCPTNEN